MINKFFIKLFFKINKPLSKTKVGIVITSYNHIDYTEKALESFYSTINEKIDYDLWLLDDNSTEDIERIYNKYKNHGLKFFKNKTTTGLTSLWNKGFELNKDKDYLIICNNDVIFSNHWAENLIYTLQKSLFFTVAVPITNAPGHIPDQHISNFVKNYITTDNQNEINFYALKFLKSDNKLIYNENENYKILKNIEENNIKENLKNYSFHKAKGERCRGKR